jgi:hypothetical protein
MNRVGCTEVANTQFRGIARLASQMCEEIPSYIAEYDGYDPGCPLTERLVGVMVGGERC